MKFYGASVEHDLAYSDVFLVPSHSALSSRFDVSLATDEGLGLQIPIVSANMNAVTGHRLAATLARRGGLGVLPQDMNRSERDEAIRWVKSQHTLFSAPEYAFATERVVDILRRVPAVSGYPIAVLDDEEHRTFLGAIDAARLADALLDAPLGDLVNGALSAFNVDDVPDGRAAFDMLTAVGQECAPILQQGHLIGTLSKKGALRSTIYRPALDPSGRLQIAAALGVNGDAATTAHDLVTAGVDVLVIDTAHGDQDAMLRAITSVAALQLGVPIVAGNVVTPDAVRALVDAGADIVKVGVGPGAMCTTRMMTAVGRPQFSAVLETSATARECGAHVWADGGVRYPRDVALALAAGASSVMIGSWFAGTLESPGPVHTDERGALYKTSWGMASTKAVTARFQRLSEFERAKKELFAEGISDSTIYLDPLRPSVEDLLDMITAGLRSSLTYAGAASLPEFHERAQVGIQSAAGYEEGKPLPVGW